ncbi:hypothetical protein [Sinomonas humi]|uniref:hypothetical protein n=1 Tax=Sinomonas humi TaxID=1338436 RepID=UPI0012E06F51|nr:hypothetical protein [Sinomonas humi]
MQQNPQQDPDRVPDETLFEQAAELAALTAEDSRLGPADLLWVPEKDRDTP